jgi:hypothetical protein
MLIPVRTGPTALAEESRPWAERIPPELVLVVTITVLGAAIRLATLGSQSYWSDEALTVHGAGSGFSVLWRDITHVETTPPLYFVLAWLWAHVFGTGEVALRMLSALFGIGLIPVAFLCGRELISRAAGLVAATLTALSPFMIWYSQEARSYALFALLSALSFLYWVRTWKDPTTSNLRWWAAFSALAVLTHFFAGFLVGPEGLLLLYRMRNRAAVVAVGVIIVAQIAVLPLALGDTGHGVEWIQAYPLSVRIQQVPVDFGLSSLYQSSIVTRGVLGAAVVALIALVLIVVGGTRAVRRGAAFAAGLAATVVLVPLVLAELGEDFYVPRNMIGAWIPLAVVLAAACTAPRARLPGAAFALVLLAGFIYAGVRIDRNPQYQRPNWRGVATALGRPIAGARAIVAYDGDFAAQPLAVYLHGVPWPSGARAGATVPELDIVGSAWQTTPPRLPPGVQLLSRTPVDGLLVTRFALSPARQLTQASASAEAAGLLTPAPAGPSVLIQR